jgi:hypothetical protein
MEGGPGQLDLRHLHIRDPAAESVLARIQGAGDAQAGGRGGGRNQSDNGRIAEQGLAAPISADE